MPDWMMRRARLPCGNSGACPGHLPAIGRKAAGPVSVYGMTETSRSTDVPRFPNRSGRRSGSGAAHPGLLPLPCPVAVGGAGTRAGPAAREHPPRGSPGRANASVRDRATSLRAYDIASLVVDS